MDGMRQELAEGRENMPLTMIFDEQLNFVIGVDVDK